MHWSILCAVRNIISVTKREVALTLFASFRSSPTGLYSKGVCLVLIWSKWKLAKRGYTKNFIGWPKSQLQGPPPSLPLVQAGAAANGRDRERRPTAETPSV